MQALKTWLAVLGTFLISYYLTMAAAVYGVVLVLAGTNGEIGHVKITPWWGWRWHAEHVTEWGAYGWGEPLLTVLIPLLIFFTIWTLRSRLSVWALAYAAVAMGAMGTNELVNTLNEMEPSRRLLAMGTTKAFMVGVSVAMCVGSLILGLPLVRMLGLGRGRCSLPKTLLIVGTPMMLYLTAMMAYHLADEPDLRMVWIGYLGAGAVVLAVGVTLGHLAAPLFDQPGVVARSPRISWWTAGVSVLAAAVLIALSALSLYPFAE